MNNMEEELWNYIDGFCTEEERKAIALRIENDGQFRRKYEELMAFQQNISAMELDEPSMGFTYKVIENIRTVLIIKPLKTRVNQRIIGGITAFFICTIMLLLGYVFANINWLNQTTLALPEIKLPQPNSYFNQAVIKGFLFFDVVLGLFFLDHYFRKLFFKKN